MVEKSQWTRRNTYADWRAEQALDAIKDYFIPNLYTVSLKPWPRMGGSGIFINLLGTADTDDAYVCEIPPGEALKPERHLYEELILVLLGRGATTVWQSEGEKQTFEWQEGSLFSPPLNAWHQIFNGQGDEPARFLAVTSAPFVMGLIGNLDFVFQNNFVFKDRFNGEANYFSSNGKSRPTRVWESNFIPDVYSFPLQEQARRGLASRNIHFQMAENTMAAHISEFAVGTYKKAHRHGPGAHVIILSGKGYSLMWENWQRREKIDWQKGSMFVPPERWFHQHFNTGPEPARYLALRWGGSKFLMGERYQMDTDVRSGGDQIEYDDEDPDVRELYKTELAKVEIDLKMDFTGKRS
jgi:oxalate decarboxylase/phosphoglucose isomerase-like protein (cupin superfamily)